MIVNPQKNKHVKHKEALEFVNWIISEEGQNAIAPF
jgi:ABC-type tungstate transport system permease subunit